MYLYNKPLPKCMFSNFCIFSTNMECLDTHDPNTMGMAGMPSDLVNVKKKSNNKQIASERDTLTEISHVKKPWEPNCGKIKAIVFLPVLLPKLEEIC